MVKQPSEQAHLGVLGRCEAAKEEEWEEACLRRGRWRAGFQWDAIWLSFHSEGTEEAEAFSRELAPREEKQTAARLRSNT